MFWVVIAMLAKLCYGNDLDYFFYKYKTSLYKPFAQCAVSYRSVDLYESDSVWLYTRAWIEKSSWVIPKVVLVAYESTRSQLKWGFTKVVITRAGRLWEWSQGELWLYWAYLLYPIFFFFYYYEIETLGYNISGVWVRVNYPKPYLLMLLSVMGRLYSVIRSAKTNSRNRNRQTEISHMRKPWRRSFKRFMQWLTIFLLVK